MKSQIINCFKISWIIFYLFPLAAALTKYACITAGDHDSSSGEYDSSSSEELYGLGPGNTLYGSVPGVTGPLLKGTLSCFNTPQTSILVTKYIHGYGGLAKCASPSEDCDEKHFSDPEITPMCDGQTQCIIRTAGRQLKKCGITSNFIHVEYECVYSWSLFNICKDVSTVVHHSSVFVASPNFFQNQQGDRKYHICECIAKSLYDDQIMLQYIHTDLLASNTGQCKGNYVLIESKTNPNQTNVDKKTEICGKRTINNQLHKGTIRITYSVESDSKEDGFLTKLLARELGPGHSAKIGMECGPVPDTFMNETLSIRNDSRNDPNAPEVFIPMTTSTTTFAPRSSSFQGNNRNFNNPRNMFDRPPNPQFVPLAPPPPFRPQPRIPPPPSFANQGRDSFTPNTWQMRNTANNNNNNNQNNFGDPGPQDGPLDMGQNTKDNPSTPTDNQGSSGPPDQGSSGPPDQGSSGPPDPSHPSHSNRPQFMSNSFGNTGGDFRGHSRGPPPQPPPPPNPWSWRWNGPPPPPPQRSSDPFDPRPHIPFRNEPPRNLNSFTTFTPPAMITEKQFIEEQQPPQTQNGGRPQTPNSNSNATPANRRVSNRSKRPRSKSRRNRQNSSSNRRNRDQGSSGRDVRNRQTDQSTPDSGASGIANKVTQPTATVPSGIEFIGQNPNEVGTTASPPDPSIVEPIPAPPVNTDTTSSAPVAAAIEKNDSNPASESTTGTLVGYVMGGIGAILCAVCGLVITFLCTKRRKRNHTTTQRPLNRSRTAEEPADIAVYTLPTTFEYSHPVVRSCGAHDNSAYEESNSSSPSIRSELSGSFESININDDGESEDVYQTLDEITEVPCESESQDNETHEQLHDDENCTKQCQTEGNLELRISSKEALYDNNVRIN